MRQRERGREDAEIYLWLHLLHVCLSVGPSARWTLEADIFALIALHIAGSFIHSYEACIHSAGRLFMPCHWHVLHHRWRRQLQHGNQKTWQPAIKRTRTTTMTTTTPHISKVFKQFNGILTAVATSVPRLAPPAPPAPTVPHCHTLPARSSAHFSRTSSGKQ